MRMVVTSVGTRFPRYSLHGGGKDERVERQRFFRELDVTIDVRRGLVSVIRMFCDFGIWRSALNRRKLEWSVV